MPAVDNGRLVLPDQKGARPYSGLWLRAVPSDHPKRLAEGCVDVEHETRRSRWDVQGPATVILPAGWEKEFSLKRKLLKDEVVAMFVGRDAPIPSRRQAGKII